MATRKTKKADREREFVVRTTMTVSISTRVRAKSLGEARELALERSVADLCHQCSDEHEGEWSVELDGEIDTDKLEIEEGF